MHVSQNGRSGLDARSRLDTSGHGCRVADAFRIDDDIVEYPTDPELIYDDYKNKVDAVIDGGYGSLYASTVIDCTGDEPEIVRMGSVEPDI